MVEEGELESEEDLAVTKEVRLLGIRLAGCYFGIAWTIGEIAHEDWWEAFGAGIPTALACFEFLPGVLPFPPEPPMPPVTPPPGPPEPPFPWPPPGTWMN